jgi:hypothetical protein
MTRPNYESFKAQRVVIDSDSEEEMLREGKNDLKLL